MAPGLGGIDVKDLLDGPSKSLFASSYPFWEVVGATMWDVVIACGVLVAFGIVLFVFAAFATMGWEMLRSLVEWVREQ